MLTLQTWAVWVITFRSWQEGNMLNYWLQKCFSTFVFEKTSARWLPLTIPSKAASEQIQKVSRCWQSRRTGRVMASLSFVSSSAEGRPGHTGFWSHSTLCTGAWSEVRLGLWPNVTVRKSPGKKSWLESAHNSQHQTVQTQAGVAGTAGEHAGHPVKALTLQWE